MIIGVGQSVEVFAQKGLTEEKARVERREQVEAFWEEVRGENHEACRMTGVAFIFPCMAEGMPRRSLTTNSGRTR